nr:MAG TPA: hypothetical protein [Crassvirales sp.]
MIKKFLKPKLRKNGKNYRNSMINRELSWNL